MINTDLRIRTAEVVKRGLEKGAYAITLYQRRVMANKLKPIFTVGQRVTVKASGTVYTGTVLSNEKRIYTDGTNGYLEVMCKWDNPAPYWTDGIFGFNQIHLARIAP